MPCGSGSSGGSQSPVSDEDRVLLSTLDTRRTRPLHTGRFLTLHKRRRKRLCTRQLVEDRALLDDVYHGPVQVSPLHLGLFSVGQRQRLCALARHGIQGAHWLPLSRDP